MNSRRLQFLAEVLALLFVFEHFAAANNAACVFERLEFGNSHPCFPSAVAIPPFTAHTISGVMGTLGGAFVGRTNDSRNHTIKGNVLTLYPTAIIPIRHRAQNGTSDPFYILFRMIFMPTGPHHSALRRSR